MLYYIVIYNIIAYNYNDYYYFTIIIIIVEYYRKQFSEVGMYHEILKWIIISYEITCVFISNNNLIQFDVE